MELGAFDDRLEPEVRASEIFVGRSNDNVAFPLWVSVLFPLVEIVVSRVVRDGVPGALVVVWATRDAIP